MTNTNPMAAEIVQTPDVIGGQWRIAGTRISVALIQGWAGSSIADIIEAYPDLSETQINAAMAFKLPASPSPIEAEEALGHLSRIETWEPSGDNDDCCEGNFAALRSYITASAAEIERLRGELLMAILDQGKIKAQVEGAADRDALYRLAHRMGTDVSDLLSIIERMDHGKFEGPNDQSAFKMISKFYGAWSGDVKAFLRHRDQGAE